MLSFVDVACRMFSDARRLNYLYCKLLHSFVHLIRWRRRMPVAISFLDNRILSTRWCFSTSSSSFSCSSHGVYSSWALPCPPPIASSPSWLPSSMLTRSQYSVASDPPQLHVARVFLSAASSRKESFGLLMRLSDDDLHQAIAADVQVLMTFASPRYQHNVTVPISSLSPSNSKDTIYRPTGRRLY